MASPKTEMRFGAISIVAMFVWIVAAIAVSQLIFDTSARAQEGARSIIAVEGMPSSRRIVSLFEHVATLDQLHDALTGFRAEVHLAMSVVARLRTLHESATFCKNVRAELDVLSNVSAGTDTLKESIDTVDSWLGDATKSYEDSQSERLLSGPQALRLFKRNQFRLSMALAHQEFRRLSLELLESQKIIESLLNAIPRFLHKGCAPLSFER